MQDVNGLLGCRLLLASVALVRHSGGVVVRFVLLLCLEDDSGGFAGAVDATRG